MLKTRQIKKSLFPKHYYFQSFFENISPKPWSLSLFPQNFVDVPGSNKISKKHGPIQNDITFPITRRPSGSL